MTQKENDSQTGKHELAMAKRVAIGCVTKYRGRFFDPEVVDHFVTMLEEQAEE